MIVITGASGELGHYLYENLSRCYEAVGTYNTNTAISERGKPFYRLNVCDSESIKAFVESVKDRLNRIVLINAVGITEDGMGHKMGEDTWDRVMDTNLKGTFLVCRALLPFMRAQEWGRIINISSVVGQMGVPGTVAYSASKSGLFGLTRTLASENVSKNITVNALALGYFNVGIIKAIKPEFQEQIRKRIPMQRFGDPKALLLAVRFLIECDYVTGTTININGGLF